MANTRMSAKNGFSEGLVLDISPENMSANSMSAALNATLCTFNGNEMALLNDMGNGRVETAFLPEGYVPVGTCEFGDIIYIVSYNPLINKSLIGCFPSPERNISTEEIGGLEQSLKSDDFLEMNGGNPTGKLRATSVKKILYDNRDMTPGDKYIIYSSQLNSNNSHLSDYGNAPHKHNTFPKLVKIHVVSIEESGKIVYLDSTTRWYDNNYYLSNKGSAGNKIDLDLYRDLVNSGYSVFSSKVSGKLALLIELEKITGFSCAWEAYSNGTENSGNTLYTNYSIYMHYNWTTDHNDVNPDGVALLTSEWEDNKYYLWKEEGAIKLDYEKGESYIGTPPQTTATSRYTTFSRHYSPETIGTDYSEYLSINYESQIEKYKNNHKLNIAKGPLPIVGRYYIDCAKVIGDQYYNGKGGIIYDTEINDSLVNNYFHYPVIKKFADFKIPTKLKLGSNENPIYKDPDISRLIYHYKIAPTMPYGILEEYALEGYIDFSKLGSKHINVNTWKYYNYENTSTLTWGMEAYTEPNKGISEVVFEFYDNNGFVAAYHTRDKLSYNGVFTEYLTLNESGTNYKLNNIPAFPELDAYKNVLPVYHPGLEVNKETAVPGFMYLHEDKLGDTSYENWVTYSTLKKDAKADDKYYMDDSGTLYSNSLYLVKIIIKYCNKNILGELIEEESSVISDYRWFWTNNMFNEYYHQEKDFKNLQATLTLDGAISYETTNNWEIKNYNYTNNNIKAVDHTNADESLSANIQLVQPDKDNIKMTVTAGLLDDYGTFNLNKGTLGLIICNIHLANEYLNNSPEKPEVIFSDTETVVNESIYPKQEKFENNSLSSYIKSLSPTLNKLINSESTDGTGDELWEDSTQYKSKFTTNYSDSVIPGGIHYIKYDGTYTDEVGDSNNKIATSVIEGNLQEAYDGYSLKLEGIYFSKYYYLTKKEDKVGRLRPFVLEESDLANYNISLNGATFFFNKAILFSQNDRSGLNGMLNGAICKFNSPTDCFGFDSLTRINSKGEDSTEGGGEGNIPASLFFNVNIDKILLEFKFLLPIGFGWTWDKSSSNVAKLNKKGSLVISTNEKIQVKTYSSLALGGTLAAILGDNSVEMGYHYKSCYVADVNILTRFMPYVLGYLTQFYYLDNSIYLVDVPSNYVYLDSNYLEYVRDIVLELYPSTKLTNHTNLVLFKLFMTLYEYIKAIKNKTGMGDIDNDPNVNIELKNSLKNCPLICKFNYVLPSMLYSSTNYIEVNSCFEEVPKVIASDFTPSFGVVYGWDFNAKLFKNSKEFTTLNISDYSVDSNSLIKAIRNSTYIDIYKLAKYLQVQDDNILLFRTIDGITSSNYGIYTWDKDGVISNLKSGIKYY